MSTGSAMVDNRAGRPSNKAVPMTGKIDGRQSRHAHRRGELIRAAADYVTENGFESLSMRPLAAAIGVTHATLLHHFGSKEALLGEVLHELRERHRLFIAAEGERLRGTPVDEVVRTAWRHLSAPSDRAYMTVVFRTYGSALTDPDTYAPFLDGASTDWIKVVGEILAEAGCPGPRVPGLATLIVGSFRGILLDLVVTHDTARAQQAIEILAATVARESQVLPGDSQPQSPPGLPPTASCWSTAPALRKRTEGQSFAVP
ncbi:TetR/AcrR family transcriptional regulator [Kitasatospora sp. NPDC101155]|uniref:TetR/AcrR family transcriptional regulator n=1 Tax=Kitasatospora sp. NPDC101155 TaxID=3364097 RepID=UPI0038165912